MSRLQVSRWHYSGLGRERQRAVPVGRLLHGGTSGCSARRATQRPHRAPGTHLLLIYQGNTLPQFADRKVLRVLCLQQAAVKALAWCPFERNLLATGGGTADRCIKFWNGANGALLNSVDTGSQVCSLLWSKHEKELLSSHGFSENQLCLWKYPRSVSSPLSSPLLSSPQVNSKLKRCLHPVQHGQGQGVHRPHVPCPSHGAVPRWHDHRVRCPGRDPALLEHLRLWLGTWSWQVLSVSHMELPRHVSC